MRELLTQKKTKGINVQPKNYVRPPRHVYCKYTPRPPHPPPPPGPVGLVDFVNEINKSEFAVGHSQSGYSSTDSWSNWNLECWFLLREENQRTQRKTPEQGREPTTNSMHMWCHVRNRIHATLVGGKYSHHCTIPAPIIHHLSDGQVKFLDFSICRWRKASGKCICTRLQLLQLAWGASWEIHFLSLDALYQVKELNFNPLQLWTSQQMY